MNPLAKGRIIGFVAYTFLAKESKSDEQADICQLLSLF